METARAEVAVEGRGCVLAVISPQEVLGFLYPRASQQKGEHVYLATISRWMLKNTDNK